MSKYMVDSSDLTSIADAIRSKTETDAPLEFPDGFVSTVENIKDTKFTSLIDRSITTLTANDLVGITEIGSYAFSSCTSLTSIDIPDSVTSIGEYAFYGCTSLTSITIPDSVTSIKNSAFNGCASLTSVTIGNGVWSIGTDAFYRCASLESVIIGNSVAQIQMYTFSDCTSLTSLVIPDNVTLISGYAFRNCTSLESVMIGEGVARIGSMAFDNCTSLMSLTCYATTPPQMAGDPLQNVPANCSIYVPAASVEAYKAATYWSARAQYIQAIPQE